MPSDDEVLIHKHTRREFRERLGRGELKACILPVAAMEQHLEHLAMEHDWRSATHVAVEAAKRLHPQVVVAMPMAIGISEHHMRHPGTLTALPGSWLAVLFDAIESIRRAGISNILVLNGHGGNVAPARGVWGQLLQRTGANLHFLPYWELLPDEVAQANLKTGRMPGHAQEFETAFALAVFPENVRTDAMRDQDDKEPLEATAEAGRAMVNAIVAEVARYVQEMIDGKRVAEIPAFF